MKTTLTSADPSGWYLCDYVYDDCNFNFCARGMLVQWTGNSLIYCGDLVQGNDWAGLSNFRPIGDEVFNEELRTLREANERLSATLLEASAELSRLKSQPYVMRRADKPDCAGVWMDNCGGVDKYDSDELEEMEPDWSPYYYMGPLPEVPVIVEQQPPKVVKVRCKKTGQVCRAIPSPCGKWQAMIGDDGSFLGNESVDNWEGVQS